MLGDRVVKSLQKRVTVLPFHRAWIRSVFQPDIEIGALSCPRGSAKSWVAGHLAAECLRPETPLFESGIECLAVSGSLEQSRIILSFVKEGLDDVLDAYRILDSSQRLTITHKATGTRLRVLSSSGRRAMGLSQFSTIFADEPGSWNEREGALMWTALTGSLGKREGQRLLVIGTRAPAEAHTWWPELIDAGSGNGLHVTALTAPDNAPWDSWDTLRKVNPLVRVNASLRRTILRERDAARKNPTLRPAYEAYRLNRQVDVFATPLVTAAEWTRVEAREVPPRKGRPIVGLDLGSERSWSAAWCLFENGRSECYAVCPGLPSIEERERQDAIPRGLYRELVNSGRLIVDEGLYVSRPQTLIDHLVEQGINPDTIYCDTFAFGDLKGVVRGRCPLEKTADSTTETRAKGQPRRRRLVRFHKWADYSILDPTYRLSDGEVTDTPIDDFGCKDTPLTVEETRRSKLPIAHQQYLYAREWLPVGSRLNIGLWDDLVDALDAGDIPAGREVVLTLKPSYPGPTRLLRDAAGWLIMGADPYTWREGWRPVLESVGIDCPQPTCCQCGRKVPQQSDDGVCVRCKLEV